MSAPDWDCVLPDWYCEHGYFNGGGCPDCDVPAWMPAVLSNRSDMARDCGEYERQDATRVIPYQAEVGITVMGRGVVAYLPSAFTMREAQALCDRVNSGERASQVFPVYSRPPYCSAAKVDARAARS